MECFQEIYFLTKRKVIQEIIQGFQDQEQLRIDKTLAK